jgi:2-polyprenyl-6-methoxyphenol hydroxylase-like FAD-dependent oxidoreductase
MGTDRRGRSSDGAASTVTVDRAGRPTGHAIVIGASIAGLVVARALTDRFDRVTVLERDRLPDRPAPRRGVPQGRHVHLLLAAGARALEELFPGLLDELFAAGASDVGIDRARLCFNGHRLARMASDTAAVGASRPLVEAHVRRRVATDPAIGIRHRTEVRGLIAGPDRRRITGVRTVARTGGDGAPPTDGDGAEQELWADLVVDCSGRRSRTPRWLAALGYPPPPVDELPVDVRYATRHYRVPTSALAGDRLIAIGPTPSGGRGGVALSIEGARWVVTLYGLCGRRPALDPDGFEALTTELPIGDIRDLVRVGEPLDEPTGFRYPANRRHRYEQLDRLPHGLLVAGDAVCTFNPIYGQGMTVAALQATALRRLLRGPEPPTPRRWFDVVTPTIDAAWDVATGADLAIDGVPGRGRVADRLGNAYVTRLHAAARTDPVLTERFVRVSGLLDPPSRLLRPATVARVLRGAVRDATRGGRRRAVRPS